MPTEAFWLVAGYFIALASVWGLSYPFGWRGQLWDARRQRDIMREQRDEARRALAEARRARSDFDRQPTA